MKTKIIFFLVLIAALGGSASGQGFRFDAQVSQQVSTTVVSGATNVLTVPASPQIAFCGFPANAVPCTNKATTYTSQTLITPCSTSTQIVLAGTTSCVASPDAQDNWGVWVPAGMYSYTITLPGGINLGPYAVALFPPNANYTLTGQNSILNYSQNGIVFVDGNKYPATGAGLQSAINAACNGTIPGHVVISVFGTISTIGVTIPSFCEVEGEGEGATILQLPSSSAASATVLANATQSGAGNQYIYVHDLTIDGNKAGQVNTGQTGINFNRVSSSTLFHVECKNSMGLAASCVQWNTPGANSNNHDNAVEFSYFHDNGSSSVNNADGLAIGGVRIRIAGIISENNTDSGVGLQGGGTTDISITNGVYKSNTLTGVALGATGATQGDNARIAIENNVFNSNGVSIACFRANDVVITGNTMYLTAGSGNIEHLLMVSTLGATISGNRMNGATTNGITITDTLATDLTQGVAISGNTITLNGQAGIRVNISNNGALIKNVAIVGNTITDNSKTTPNSTDAINVSVSAGPLTAISGLVITDNILSDDQGAPSQRYGLAFTAGMTVSAVIGGNQWTGNATGTAINVPTDAGSVFSMGVPPVPYADNTLSEGTAAKRWSNVFTVGLKLDGTIQNSAATATMGLTQKNGSGAGNYSGTNTAYANVDTTNLCQVVTIPTGWKLGIKASGVLQSITAAVAINISVADIGTTCGAGGVTPLKEVSITPPAFSVFDEAWTLDWVVTGDGAAHAISLQAKTANVADGWGIQNTSSSLSPSIVLTLMPSN